MPGSRAPRTLRRHPVYGAWYVYQGEARLDSDNDQGETASAQD